MRRIVYISTALGLDDSDLAAILASAQRFNSEHGITGFLLYNGRNFLQLIEGESASLDALMARLEQDGRHSGIVRLIDIETQTRCCEGWSMQFVAFARALDRRKADLAARLPALDGATAGLVDRFAMLN